MNHRYLYYWYELSIPIHCRCLMNSVHFDTMRQILGIVLCCQYQMMILVWRYFSLWNISKPCPSLLCYYHKYEVPKYKGGLIIKERRYYPKFYHPKYMILLWKVFSWWLYCWIMQKKMWQEVILSCTCLCALRWNIQPSWYHFHWIKQCYYCEICTVLIWI